MRYFPCKLTTLVSLALAVGLCPFVTSAWGQSADLDRYVLFGTDGIRGRGLQMQDGDAGVNQGAFVIRRSIVNVPNSELSGPFVRLPDDAQCGGVVAGDATSSTPACPVSDGFEQPFPDLHSIEASCGYPDPFPACSADPSRNVLVNLGETKVLEPGAYGFVKVRGTSGFAGHLELLPGSYTFCGLRLRQDATIDFSGPTTVNVTRDLQLSIGTVANLGGAFGRDVNLFVAGRVRISKGAAVNARICAPSSDIRLAWHASVFGRVVGRIVKFRDLTAGFPTTTTTSTSTSSTTSTSTSSSTSTSTSSSTSSSTSTSTSTSSSTSSTSSTSTSTSSTTSTSLPPARCGDGVKNQPSEECDDGNAIDDDCCSSSCKAAPDGQSCDDGNPCTGDESCMSGVCLAPTVQASLECQRPFTSALITNFDEGTVSVAPVTGTAVAATVPVGNGPWGVAIRPGGHEMWVTIRDEAAVVVLDTDTRAVLDRITVGRTPLGIVFDDAGARAFVASFDDDSVSVIDADSRSVVATVPVGVGPAGLVLGPSRDVLYVSQFGKRNIAVIDLATLTVRQTIRTRKQPLEMDVDTHRGRLYVANFEGHSVSVIGTISDRVLATLRVGKNPFGVAVDEDRNRVYVTNAASDTLSIIDGDTCDELDQVPVGRGPLGIELDPRKDRAYVAIAGESRVTILGTDTGAVVGNIATGKSPVGFGNFIGATANSCPRAAVTCDDANPLTTDSCTPQGTCVFEPLPPREAVTEGLAVLAGLVEGVTAGTTPKVAGRLGRYVGNAQGQVTGGQAARRQFQRVRKQMKKLGKTTRSAVRRHRLGCDAGLRLMDLAAGVELNARRAARGE